MCVSVLCALSLVASHCKHLYRFYINPTSYSDYRLHWHSFRIIFDHNTHQLMKFFHTLKINCNDLSFSRKLCWTKVHKIWFKDMETSINAGVWWHHFLFVSQTMDGHYWLRFCGAVLWNLNGMTVGWFWVPGPYWCPCSPIVLWSWSSVFETVV